jgi:hypothetical protein
MRQSRKRGGKGGETYVARVSGAGDIERDYDEYLLAKRNHEDQMLQQADDDAYALGQQNLAKYLQKQEAPQPQPEFIAEEPEDLTDQYSDSRTDGLNFDAGTDFKPFNPTTGTFGGGYKKKRKKKSQRRQKRRARKTRSRG